jgi:hypothetical protein
VCSCRTPRIYSSSDPSTLPVFGFTRCLCARKARHLDVGEVIVFGIISGPSELVIKVRSLRRPVGGCSSFSCRCTHASFVRETLSFLCAEKQCCSNCSTTTAHAEWHMRVSQNEPSVTISSSVTCYARGREATAPAGNEARK